MHQRFYCPPKILSSVFLVLLLLAVSNSVIFAQDASVVFDNIYHHSTDEALFGKQPGFPAYIISQFRVLNQHGHYVRDLASTEEWLSEQDTIPDLQLPVHKVWSTVREYWRDNTGIPEGDAQIVDHFYVREVDSLLTSVVLVMDYSSSMDDATLLPAIEGAEALIKEVKKTEDRMSIISFNKSVIQQIPFTTDTSSLVAAIPGTEARGFYTALYQAIMSGVETVMTEEQEGEVRNKVVIVYTDGKNQLPDDVEDNVTVQEIIDKAKEHHVYVFGLGIRSYQDGDVQGRQEYYDNLEILNRITRETTGVKIQMDGYDPYELDTRIERKTKEEWLEAYKTIYSLLPSYYLLADSTTDPRTNGVWRTVDITVKKEGEKIQGKDHYEPPDVKHDLAVTKRVYQHNGTEEITYADPGNMLDYRILVENKSDSSISGEVTVVDRYPEKISLSNFVFSPQPLDFSVDTVARTINVVFPNLYPETEINMSYSAAIDSALPARAVTMRNVVTAYADLDRELNLSNNIDSVTVEANGIPDFAVRAVCHASSDVASPGYPLELEAIVTNVGHTDAVKPFKVSFFVQNLDDGSEEIYLGDTKITASQQSTVILEIGKSMTVSYVWQSPDEGRYRLRVVVDRDSEVRESNEENNEGVCSDIPVGIRDLKVRISDISITDAVPALQASFPDSVLSTVMVLDQNNNPIKGQASLTDWISGGTLTDFGRSVQETWVRLHEYDRYNTDYPDMQDATESILVRESQDADIQLAITVDENTELASWQTAITDVLEAFIDEMHTADQMLMFNVNEGSVITQPLTSNKTSLTNKITSLQFNKTVNNLYPNLSQGVQSIGVEGGRNAILAILGTDDNTSGTSAYEVRELALKQGVPVYIAQIGSTSSADLEGLSEETGGWYFHATDADELETAIILFQRMLRNYYWVRHESTDQLKNQKWRTVDLQVESYGYSDDDSGHYRAAKGLHDATIVKESSIIRGPHGLAQNVTGDVVMPLDTILYTIRVSNLGDYTLPDITVVDHFPDSLAAPLFVDEPAQTWLPDSASWHLDSLEVAGFASFSVQFVVDTLWFPEEMYFLNTASFRCAEDSVDENNTYVDTLIYRPLSVPDLQISKTAIVKHPVGVEDLNLGETEIQPGETVDYTITLTNPGGQTMRNIRITESLPQEMTFLDISASLTSETDQSLEWFVSSIGPGESLSWHLLCRMDTVNYATGADIINRVRMECAADTLESNNEAEAVLDFRELTPVDLRIKKAARSDSTGFDGREFVRVEGIVEYTITVINDGQLACNGMTFVDQIPELLSVISLPESGSETRARVVEWSASRLVGRDGAVKDSVQFTYRCQAAEERDTLALVNRVTVQCPDEPSGTTENNTTTETVYLIPIRPNPPTIYVVNPASSQIDSTHSLAFPSNSSDVRLQLSSPIDIESGQWSLTFYKGSINEPCETPDASTYAMGTANTNFPLTAGQPFFVDLDSVMVRLCGGMSSQDVYVVLETLDQFDYPQTSTTKFRVESVNRFVLDRNVFKPTDQEPQYQTQELRLTVQLKETNQATLTIYDISGGFIKELRNAEFPTWETFAYWDGRDEKGNLVGSGIYIAILSSDVFKQARKFIVVR